MRVEAALRFLARPVMLLSALLLSISAAGAQTGTELSLHEAIAAAERSAQAREAQDRVDERHGMVTQAGLRPNPRLFLQSEDIEPWVNNFSYTTQTEEYGYISQTFELGGKRSSRLGAARATLQHTEAERVLALQSIAGRVAGAYWAAVVSTSVMRVLQEDMSAVDQIVEYNHERVDAGATRGVDLLRTQIERDRLQLLLASARRQVVFTRAELFRQMGRPPGPASLQAGVTLTDSLDSLQPIETKTIETVLASRADVQVAREAVAVAQADVKLQRANGVPDVDLLGGYKRNLGANTLFTALQIPLPFSNRNQGEVERAEASVHLAQDRLEQLEVSVRADVKEAEESYMEQRHVTQDVLPDMRSRAKRNLAIMDDAYRTGGVDLLHFLDAERTEFDVEVSALRTLAEFQQAGLRLQLAYGMRP